MRLIEDHPGRVGYLLKERILEIAVLVETLKRIVDGETVIDPTFVSRLDGRQRRDDPISEPTDGEREVLGLLPRACRTMGSPLGCHARPVPCAREPEEAPPPLDPRVR